MCPPSCVCPYIAITLLPDSCQQDRISYNREHQAAREYINEEGTLAEREGENPTWLGMKLFWDEEWDFSFWHETRWKRFKFEDGRPGIIVAPEESNRLTTFSVQPRDLDMEVTKEDLPVLTEGFIAGLQSLPDCKIESQEESVTGSLIILDARLTFTEDGETRKRWVQLVYKGKRQYLLVGQGATVEDFEWWLPMFFMATNTFVIGPRFDIPGGWPPLPARQEKIQQMQQRLEEAMRKRQAKKKGEIGEGDEQEAEDETGDTAQDAAA